jgi:hypothetical protein
MKVTHLVVVGYGETGENAAPERLLRPRRLVFTDPRWAGRGR